MARRDGPFARGVLGVPSWGIGTSAALQRYRHPLTPAIPWHAPVRARRSAGLHKFYLQGMALLRV